MSKKGRCFSVYSAVYISDSGGKYVFGKDGLTMFDMNVGDGVSISLGTSQGFSQVGETIESQTVSGRVINVSGVVYGDVSERKRTMRKVIAPFTSGRLIFQGTHYTRVTVKAAPSFSPVKEDGRFSLQFFAPFPFFYSIDTKGTTIGGVAPLFSFPVNYAESHQFGEKAFERYTNVLNTGDVKVPFSVTLQSTGKSSNINIANLETFEFLKINGTLNADDVLNIYRDAQNILRAELQTNGRVEDVISWIDEDSALFELNVGDNLILATDDEGGANLITRFTYNPAVVALYES